MLIYFKNSKLYTIFCDFMNIYYKICFFFIVELNSAHLIISHFCNFFIVRTIKLIYKKASKNIKFSSSSTYNKIITSDIVAV